MKICDLVDIPPGGARGFRIPGGDGGLAVLIARRGAGIHAYVNRCPHTGVNLDWNPDEFMDVEGQHLQCATHGALFRVEDGFCLHGPCYGQGLTPLPIRVEDGAILLERGVVPRPGG